MRNGAARSPRSRGESARTLRDFGMTDQLVVPVILCGGAGTRLWPVSREKMPKQFVPLIGASWTFRQGLDLVTCEGLFALPMIITNSELRFVVAQPPLPPPLKPPTTLQRPRP